MDPTIALVFDVVGKLGALGVALYALRQSWQDKKEAVAAFTALNAEKAQLQKDSTEALKNAAVEIALNRAQLADFKDQIAELKQYIKEQFEAAGRNRANVP